MLECLLGADGVLLHVEQRLVDSAAELAWVVRRHDVGDRRAPLRAVARAARSGVVAAADHVQVGTVVELPGVPADARHVLRSVLRRAAAELVVGGSCAIGAEPGRVQRRVVLGVGPRGTVRDHHRVPRLM